MLIVFILLLALFFPLFFLPYLCRRLSNNQKERERLQKAITELTALRLSITEVLEKSEQNQEKKTPDFALRLEISPSDSTKLSCLFDKVVEDAGPVGSGLDQTVKKKKKRGKKKKLDPNSEENVDSIPGSRVKPEYPFTSTGSATQRKIKQQYDQLVKCHKNKGLTLTQLCEFVSCLIEARGELQQKSEALKRKFTITKALLSKAERSTYDRLCQQIYKIEAEQKRIEEDAFVYNWLQQQIKLSPAYKKMLEIGASMESKKEAEAREPTQDLDTDCFDISFEELLAQEKKDSFWQKYRKSRLSSS